MWLGGGELRLLVTLGVPISAYLTNPIWNFESVTYWPTNGLSGVGARDVFASKHCPVIGRQTYSSAGEVMKKSHKCKDVDFCDIHSGGPICDFLAVLKAGYVLPSVAICSCSRQIALKVLICYQSIAPLCDTQSRKTKTRTFPPPPSVGQYSILRTRLIKVLGDVSCFK